MPGKHGGYTVSEFREKCKRMVREQADLLVARIRARKKAETKRGGASRA